MSRSPWVWSAFLLSMLLGASPAQAADPMPQMLQPAELQQMIQKGEDLVLVDTMSRLECMDHSIPGSLCIAEEEFAARAPKLLPDKKRLVVFYCESDRCYRSQETATIALQQGYQRVAVLRGGIPAWKEAGFETISRERIPRVPVASIKPDRVARWLLEKRDLLILDIRREDRYREEHLPTAINIPLYRLQERYAEIPLNRPVLVVDDRGLRSFLASCYLVRKGVADVKRLFGGMAAWNSYIASKENNP